jgi:anti-sigma regulatory factor (Ser/Thr protein kinase)
MTASGPGDASRGSVRTEIGGYALPRMASVPGGPRSKSTGLRAGPRTAAEARSFLSAALESFGVDVDRDAAILLTSEIASNAARHGKEPIDITVSVEEGFRVSVFDRGAGFALEDLTFDPGSGSEPWAIGGWGLQVVDNLSSDWGVERNDGGTEVWFRL